jgi:tyrosyl-tRNA synthetase
MTPMGVSSEHWKKITRGCAEIISEAELKTKLEKPHPLRIKLGVDPTAPDLHFGHLVVLRKLKTFQELGHQIEFIIGDFTARIGDPSGQSATRPTLKPQEIWEHAKTYQDQVFRVLKKDATQVRFNSSWINALGIPGFLELARRASVAQMLERADFKERFENRSNISLLEFYYPLLQGYDSVAVQADVELGGTDQKFNLLMGRETQREYKQEPQVVMTMPLLEGLDGVKKMSKSYDNYIAFNDSPQDKFGKVMSVPDALMPKYAELLTDLDLSKLKGMHPKEAKVLLAKTLVGMFHGGEEASKAAEQFERVFSKKEVPVDIPEYKASMPISVVDLLVEAGLAASKNEARRLVDQGAVEIAGKRVDKDRPLELLNSAVVQVGKRRFVRVVPV